MAVISNLDVNLNARTQKFDGPIKRSTKTFGGFAKSVGNFSAAKFVAGVALISGAIGTLRSFGSQLERINDQFGRIDRLAKFSDEVGATVAEMQALQLQAELTGTNNDTLEKGIQRFVRRLGEAKLGIGQGVKALKELGLTSEQLINLPLTDQLGLVVDRIRQNGTEAERAAAAYALFGRQGQELMTFINGGSQGIRNATRDIERFGLGIRRVDAASIEAANDSWARMSTLVEGFYGQIAVKSAPAFKVLTDVTTEYIDTLGGVDSAAEIAIESLVKGFGKLADVYNILIGAQQRLTAEIVGGIAQSIRAADFAATVANPNAGINFRTGEFSQGIPGAKEFVKELDKNFNQLISESNKRFQDGVNGVASGEFERRIQNAKEAGQQFGKSSGDQLVSSIKAAWQVGSNVVQNNFGMWFAHQEKNERAQGGWFSAITKVLQKSRLELASEERRSSLTSAVNSSNAQSTINRLGFENRQIESQKEANRKLDAANTSLQALVGLMRKLIGKSDGEFVPLGRS